MLPLSRSGWWRAELAWLLWGPLHVVGSGLLLLGYYTLFSWMSVMSSWVASPTGALILLVPGILLVPLVPAWLVHHRWYEPRVVALQGEEEGIFLLRIPNAEAAAQVDAAVQAQATETERRLLALVREWRGAKAS